MSGLKHHIGDFATGLRLTEGILDERYPDETTIGSIHFQGDSGNLDAPYEMPAGCCHRSAFFEMPVQSCVYRP